MSLIYTVRDLLDALASGARHIAISGSLLDVPSLTLAPGQSLLGTTGTDRLQFTSGVDGIAVTADNRIERLSLAADPSQRVVYASEQFKEPSRGTISLVDLQATGQLQFLFGDATESVDLQLSRTHIERADTRHRSRRLHGNGVSCLQGALTIWNQTPREAEWRVSIDRLSIGRLDARQVLGSGIVIAGHGPSGGGRVRVDAALLGAVHIDSGLRGDSDSTICGGIFIAHGVEVQVLHCDGLQQSHGANAVAIDNWGTIGSWVIDGDVLTHGPNAVAMVNAGRLGILEVRGRIDTHGNGARGCAIYGPTGELRVRALCTRGDAAVGVQILDRLDVLRIEDGIEIRGKSGQAMVKGRMVAMNADGVHVEPGGYLGLTDIAFISIADASARGIRNDSASALYLTVH